MAFKTKYGLFEPNVMYFGLTNSPATFQAMIDHLFQPVHDEFSIDGTDVLKYMDDLLITTRSTRAHHRKAGVGAGAGAGGQARRRQSPKTHNHYPPPTVFLFRVGRGVMVTTTVHLT